MPKNLSAKYYQENKERLQRKIHEIYQIVLKKKKSDSMAANITKASRKMKSKSLFSIEKVIIK